MIRGALALALVAAGCGGAGGRPGAGPVTPVAPAARAPSLIDPAAHLETVSEATGFLVADGSNVPGTLVRPVAPGKFPAIVLFAGSGPTDRDWNSPLIKTKNGSGKLLAEALASHGAVVLRFDKAMVGDNTTSLAGKTLDVYVDETRAALAYLRSRAEVDPSHLYIAGHSEGGLHAIRTALAEDSHIAGLVLLSAAGRSLRDIVIAQITAQIARAAPDQVEAVVGPFRKALDAFIAGQAVDPKTATPIPGLQNLLASLVAPASAELARGLLTADPLAAIAKVEVPIFIYNGERDVQVDPELDAKALAAAARRTNHDVTLFLAPEADHVLKHETRSLDELRAHLAELEVDYNSPDRGLDEATVAAIVGWLAKH